MREKFKLWLENDRLFYGTSIILIGITSFGLGRLSVNGDLNGIKTTRALVQVIDPIYLPAMVSATNQIQIQDPQNTNPLSTNQEKKPPSANSLKTQVVTVVASKNSTKYHLPSCSGAKNIKPENLITFSSIAEAEKAGYQKAANCPGL